MRSTSMGSNSLDDPRWWTPSSFRMRPDRVARLDEHAAARGKTRSELLRQIVDDWLDAAGEPPEDAQRRLF